ncbi:MAG: hypothetical protein HYZ12_06670 [Thaumarchaeota archaeon]|nr:hypothetical protein [Nitrososphaerota archaeon]
MNSWMQYRIRSKWLEGNLLLVALRLLRERPLAEWEILDSLYRSFEFSPDEGKFKEFVQSLATEGYIRLSGDAGMNRLQISEDGLRLLQELEREYKDFLSDLSMSEREGSRAT